MQWPNQNLQMKTCSRTPIEGWPSWLPRCFRKFCLETNQMQPAGGWKNCNFLRQLEPEPPYLDDPNSPSWGWKKKVSKPLFFGTSSVARCKWSSKWRIVGQFLVVVSVFSYTSHLYLDWYDERDAHYSHNQKMIFGRCHHYNTKLGGISRCFVRLGVRQKTVSWSSGP